MEDLYEQYTSVFLTLGLTGEKINSTKQKFEEKQLNGYF